MTTSPEVAIMLDGQPFATRHWTIIPRRGDTLMFEGGKIWAKVVDVLWADYMQKPPSGQWVQLWCESCPPPGGRHHART